MESKVNEQIVEKETKFNLGIKMVFLESGNYNGTKKRELQGDRHVRKAWSFQNDPTIICDDSSKTSSFLL